ncbi:metallophosphoesterase family protein [Salipaludibacillus sp. HK11]|uniref:metallophosphoesterase family protein n=1 Tax=Salipaludibacillus sp. HK11 TaxID=3394320 RepID=UPI0039FD0F8E
MLKLALIGDLHYPRLEKETEEFMRARDYFYQSFIDQFTAEEASFHISIGDLTHHGYMNELEDIYRYLGQRTINFRHVLGNHDAYTNRKSDILAMINQPRYNKVETEEAILLFLDTTREMNADDWSGDMDQEQLEWLDKSIEESGTKAVMIFGHHPVYDTTDRSTFKNLSIVPEIDMKAILNKKKGPGFYFCGHNHSHSITQENQWTFVQTADCLDHQSYRLIEVDKDQVQISMITIENEHMSAQANVVHNELYPKGVPFDFLGKTDDQERVIELSTLRGVIGRG